MADKTLEEILEWSVVKAGFSHVRVHEAWYPALRASKLIECLRTKNRVVYTVITNKEKRHIIGTLYSMKMEVDDKFGNHTKAYIITHAELYALAKSEWNGGLLDPGVAVVCEVDIQYGLEFVLGMTCAMDGARVYGRACVLTVAQRGVEKSLVDGLRLIAPSMEPFQSFHMPSDQTRSLTVTHWNDKVINKDVYAKISEVLALKKSILVFATGPRPIRHSLKRCRADPMVVDDNPETENPATGEELPGVVFVPDHSRIPVAFKNLGLIVVCASHERVVFDKRSGHVVSTLVDRSESEMEAAIAHAYLSDQENLVILTNAPHDHPRPKDPPRRIETDQIEAFAFEARQLCKHLLFIDFLHCFITDIPAIYDRTVRLDEANWLDIFPVSTGRTILAAPTARARLLAKLLPLFDYDFAPAAFLAGFEGVTSPALVAAIRMAVIAHFPLQPVMPEFQIPTFAETNGGNSEEILDLIPIALASGCAFPDGQFRHGTIWVELAAWHTGAIQLNDYTRRDDDSPHFDIAPNGPLKGLLCIDHAHCQSIGRLVHRLETFFGIPPRAEGTSPSPLILTEQDCDRIYDEMLNAWMYQTLFATTTELGATYSDVVSPRAEAAELHPTEGFILESVPDRPETPQTGMFLLARRITCDESGNCSFGNIMVMPATAVKRWQRARDDAPFHLAIHTTYPREK